MYLDIQIEHRDSGTGAKLRQGDISSAHHRLWLEITGIGKKGKKLQMITEDSGHCNSAVIVTTVMYAAIMMTPVF